MREPYTSTWLVRCRDHDRLLICLAHAQELLERVRQGRQDQQRGQNLCSIQEGPAASQESDWPRKADSEEGTSPCACIARRDTVRKPCLALQTLSHEALPVLSSGHCNVCTGVEGDIDPLTSANCIQANKTASKASPKKPGTQQIKKAQSPVRKNFPAPRGTRSTQKYGKQQQQDQLWLPNTDRPGWLDGSMPGVLTLPAL